MSATTQTAAQQASPSATRAPTPACALPPPGWACTRAPGHDGPCAAVPPPAPAVSEQASTDLPKLLREYASNSGYSHNDYADIMRSAADEIERCAAVSEQADERALFEAWKGYPLPDFNSDGNFDKDWLHREWVAFKAGLARAALAQRASSAPADTFAVNFIERRAEQYLQDHADTEPDTGAVVFQYGEAGRDYYSTMVELAEDIRRECRQLPTATPASAQPVAAAPAELRKAFMTLESSGGEGRTLVLKFNQRADAYAVHEYLLNAGSQDYRVAVAPAAPVAQTSANWTESERVANIDEVDEALRGFLEDPTGDNGTCVVRAVIVAAALWPPAEVAQATPASAGEKAARPSMLYEAAKLLLDRYDELRATKGAPTAVEFDLLRHALAGDAATIPSGASAGADARNAAHGHREDFYLMANARRIGMMPIRQIANMSNWHLAHELFATGSNSAHQICVDAGIDPAGYTIDRAPMAAAQGGAK